MPKVAVFLGSAGFLVATTIGAGIFALPYVFYLAGWGLGIFYLIGLSGLIIFVHRLYWRTLARVSTRHHLPGLIRVYLGRAAFGLGSIAIWGGLLLTLVVYLILAAKFLQFIFPALPTGPALFIFWVMASLPLLLRLPRVVGAEFLGAVLIAALIFIIVLGGDGFSGGFTTLAFVPANIFLPFAPLLFALAGWTALAQIFAYEKKLNRVSRDPGSPLVVGTVFVAALYALFVLGIFGSASAITPDTVSGLQGWPTWQLALLGWLGLLAIWTSYLPMSREIKESLDSDLSWQRPVSAGIVIVLPVLLVLAGLDDFMAAVGLAGGVFLSLQYLLIILMSKKVLALRGPEKWAANFSALVFILAVVYEVYYFLAK